MGRVGGEVVQFCEDAIEGGAGAAGNGEEEPGYLEFGVDMVGGWG